jgi:predicted MPP superfamily phosphohydrolase
MAETTVDPLEHSALHTLLVQTNRLQQLPPLILALIMGLCALVVALAWDALPVAAAYLAAALVNWGALWALPRAGRSYGPDRPTALALALLLAVLMVALGLLGASWPLALALLLTITALAVYATWIEPFRLGVTRQTYTTPKWDAASKPLRLLQIGDLHIERVTARERQLNRLVRDLQPDIIVFTGDYVNLSNTHDPQAERAIREVISAWAAPLGVYCISGTPLVEPLERVRDFVRGLDNLTLLANAWATVPTPGGALNILGLVVTHDMARDRALLARMAAARPPAGLDLLLMHPPDIAPEANDSGFDLYLCGHTHGGQMRLPLVGAFFSSSHLGQRFIMGRYELGTTTLYTARGVGLEGLGAPRARFLCPPEIVLWEISGAG